MITAMTAEPRQSTRRAEDLPAPGPWSPLAVLAMVLVVVVLAAVAFAGHRAQAVPGGGSQIAGPLPVPTFTKPPTVAQADREWVTLWHEEVPRDPAADTLIIGAAGSICEARAEGMTLAGLVTVSLSDTGISKAVAGGLVQAAIDLFCPQYAVVAP